jgi:hypothetical protein
VSHWHLDCNGILGKGVSDFSSIGGDKNDSPYIMDLKIVSIFFFYSILDIMSLEFKVFDP